MGWEYGMLDFGEGMGTGLEGKKVGGKLECEFS